MEQELENRRCIVLIGATATGKSSFVYENLPEFPFHIISADSMQVYREFEIGTATPSRKELALFPHTGINELSPEENYSVADFLTRADGVLERSKSRKLVPLVLGGTGLYINAFLYGLDEMPAANRDYRRRLRSLSSLSG